MTEPGERKGPSGVARFRALGEILVKLADDLHNGSGPATAPEVTKQLWDVGASIMNECDQMEAMNCEHHYVLGVLRGIWDSPSSHLGIYEPVMAGGPYTSGKDVMEAMERVKAEREARPTQDPSKAWDDGWMARHLGTESRNQNPHRKKP